jgi:hypothetical protein
LKEAVLPPSADQGDDDNMEAAGGEGPVLVLLTIQGVSTTSGTSATPDLVFPQIVVSIIHDTDLRSKQRYYLDGNANISSFNTTSFAYQPTTTAMNRVECMTVQGEELGALVIEGRREP